MSKTQVLTKRSTRHKGLPHVNHLDVVYQIYLIQQNRKHVLILHMQGSGEIFRFCFTFPQLINTDTSFDRKFDKSARHYLQILFAYAFHKWLFWSAINHSLIPLSLLLNLCSTYKWNYKSFFNSICGKSAAGHMDYGRSNNVVSF